MSAVAVREPEGTVEERLAGLAETIRCEHDLVTKSLADAVHHAVLAGEALREAKERCPAGEWMLWLEDVFQQGYATAYIYMRIAHYKDRLSREEITTMASARRFLVGLPAISGAKSGGSIPAHPEGLKQEAIRLYREDAVRPHVIAERLDVSKTTVWRWVKGPSSQGRAAEKRAERERAARAEKALQRQEAERALKQRGGALAEGYSLLRKAAQHFDSASAQAQNAEAKRHIRRAWSLVHDAEREALRADAIEYGGQST